MIRIEGFTFGYRKKEPVFQDLELQLPGGHIYGLFGKNGAGKSTLLKSICGLVFPKAGTCEVAGYEASLRATAMLKEIFIVPEDFYLPDVSLDRYLKTYAGFYPLFNRQEFEIYLGEFDIPQSAHLGRLSYGQKKKVLISFALAAGTSVLLLDEPTNGLDIPSKSIFRRLVASAFNEERTVIVSTHQARDLDNLIDTMIILHEHKVALNASIDQILSKLAFRTAPEAETAPSGPDAALYGEASLRGRDIIVENTGGERTKMNTELFFNAVTGANDKISAILHSI